MMAARGITKYQLSKKAKIPASCLTDWDSGRVEPSAAAVQKIAAFFDVPVGYFYGDEQKTIDQKKAVKIPVLDDIPKGIPFDKIDNYIGWEEIPASWTVGAKEYFAIKVKTDQMFPEYVKDEILIISKQPVCDSGKDAIVLIDGDAAFRRVYHEHGGIRLHPLNPVYNDIFFNASDVKRVPVEILGIIVQSRRYR